MKHVSLWLLGCLTLALLSLFTLPLSNVVEGPAPLTIGENQVRLAHGTVVRQTLALPTPAPHEIAPRIWVQLLSVEEPFLRARVEHAGDVLGQTALTLPALDNAFHMVQMRWWAIPTDVSSVSLVLEGHGVVLMATAVDRVAGGDLAVDGVSQAPSDLALQLVSGDRGIERYLPLSRIAAGKPGILGWPRFSLLLMCLYVLVVAALISSVFRLQRYVERMR